MQGLTKNADTSGENIQTTKLACSSVERGIHAVLASGPSVPVIDQFICCSIRVKSKKILVGFTFVLSTKIRDWGPVDTKVVLDFAEAD